MRVAFSADTCEFQKEIETRLGKSDGLYEQFLNLFQHLPLASVVKGETARLFVVHGGVPVSDGVPFLLSTIARLNRRAQPAEDADDLVTQLLWNDPFEGQGLRDSQRGKWGQMFGGDITRQFLSKNNLSHLIRSHQDIYGVQETHGGCTTVFSGHDSHVAFLIVDDSLAMRKETHTLPDVPKNSWVRPQRKCDVLS